MADREITELEGDTSLLDKQGWHLLTNFKSADCSRAFNLAMDKAHNSERKTELRSFEKDGEYFCEVWERW